MGLNLKKKRERKKRRKRRKRRKIKKIRRIRKRRRRERRERKRMMMVSALVLVSLAHLTLLPMVLIWNIHLNLMVLSFKESLIMMKSNHLALLKKHLTLVMIKNWNPIMKKSLK